MKNERFNLISYNKKKDFLINNIMMKSDNKINRSLAKYIVDRMEVSNQYYVKVVDENRFREECILEELSEYSGDGTLTSRFTESGFSIGGLCEFGSKRENELVYGTGEVNCVAIVKIRNVFSSLKEGEFNVSNIEYEVIVKGV